MVAPAAVRRPDAEPPCWSPRHEALGTPHPYGVTVKPDPGVGKWSPHRRAAAADTSGAAISGRSRPPPNFTQPGHRPRARGPTLLPTAASYLCRLAVRIAISRVLAEEGAYLIDAGDAIREPCKLVCGTGPRPRVQPTERTHNRPRSRLVFAALASEPVDGALTIISLTGRHRERAATA